MARGGHLIINLSPPPPPRNLYEPRRPSALACRGKHEDKNDYWTLLGKPVAVSELCQYHAEHSWHRKRCAFRLRVVLRKKSKLRVCPCPRSIQAPWSITSPCMRTGCWKHGRCRKIVKRSGNRAKIPRGTPHGRHTFPTLAPEGILTGNGAER